MQMIITNNKKINKTFRNCKNNQDLRPKDNVKKWRKNDKNGNKKEKKESEKKKKNDVPESSM